MRIALLGYDGFQTLDLVGPLDAFAAANTARPGQSRARQVEALRLDAARMRLNSPTASVAALAAAFSRAFERRYRLPPSDYRRRFD